MNTARGLFKLTRFPLVFTAIADSAVGAALCGTNLLSCATWVPAAVASAFLYAGGMALNDVMDVERDRLLHPERPLPSGRVSMKAATTFALALFALAGAAGGVAGLVPMLWTWGLVALIFSYNAIFKRNDLAGSWTMAWIRGGNLALGAVVVGVMPGSTDFPLLACVVLAAYVFALTLWSTREDDRTANRGVLAGIGSALAWSPILNVIQNQPARWASLFPMAWIAPWVIRALVRPERARLMQVVRWGVLGIIILDASFLGARGRWPEAAVVAALILPALALLPAFRKL